MLNAPPKRTAAVSTAVVVAAVKSPQKIDTEMTRVHRLRDSMKASSERIWAIPMRRDVASPRIEIEMLKNIATIQVRTANKKCRKYNQLEFISLCI